MKPNFTPTHGNGSGPARPRILLADTNRWPLGPRLAMGFAELGAHVAIVCASPGHPAGKTRAIENVFKYDAADPQGSLRRAIDAVDPDVVLPLCDRSAKHLHELYHSTKAGGTESRYADLVERSLGSPESFETVESRLHLLEVARSEGVRVPEMVSADAEERLMQWCSQSAPPWVIKADGSWGGRGVRIAQNIAEARRDWQELIERPGTGELLKRLSLNRDRGWILSEWKSNRPHVLLQSYIQGRPANCGVACWKGELLAGTAVEVVQAHGPTEPALVVRVVEGSEMLRAARILAKRLNLSGIFGLDFMIEEETGHAYLIEMNPRCTPVCPLPLGSGRDLVAALFAKITDRPVQERKAVTDTDLIAYFPGNWIEVDGTAVSPSADAYYDVPLGEPELADQLLHPWSSRSTLGLVLDWGRRVMASKRSSPREYVDRGIRGAAAKPHESSGDQAGRVSAFRPAQSKARQKA